MSRDDFTKELEGQINAHSIEKGSNTPDFILADYLTGCLEVFDEAVRRRTAWYGGEKRTGQQTDPLATHFKDITTVAYLLEMMTANASSVSLNWGEDTGMWECSRIVGGERHTAHGATWIEAVRAAHG